MRTVLFCVPLKKNHLSQYEAFVTDTLTNRKSAWLEMLKRYDIHSVAIWTKHMADRDYVFVQHAVGPAFEEKLKGWDDSTNEFDQWFNAQIMAVYDIDNIEGMEQPIQLADLQT